MNFTPLQPALESIAPAHGSRGKSWRSPRITRAFSMVEILVVIALLSVIILGLVAMFNQTRKAFTSSLTQVDVLESGRSAADVIAREMEQMTASGTALLPNFYVNTVGYSMAQQLSTNSTDGSTEARTNYLEQVYFLTRNIDQSWTGIGYKLGSNGIMNGLGTLYRYSTVTIPNTNLYQLTNQTGYFDTIERATITNNYSRVVDGVIHFRVRVFGTNGALLQPAPYNSYTNGTAVSPPLYQFGFTNGANTLSLTTNQVNGEIPYYRMEGSVLPAYVEIELGVLEDRALARYNGLTNGNNDGLGSTAYAYLTNHAAAVHIFRQRIPIRNVNAAAYP